MRYTWRVTFFVLLLGLWPQFGCVHLFGEKAAKNNLPDLKKPAEAPKPAPTAAVDVTQQWIKRAEALERDGKPSEAAAVYEKMREAGGPMVVLATRKLAALYDRNNAPDRAEQEYKLLLQHNPRDADALNSLGDLAYRRGHFDTALKNYTDAVFFDNNHNHARISLGMTLAQKGDYNGGVATLTQALGSESEAYCNVASVMKLQGKHAFAAAAYQQALKIDPTAMRAQMELAQLQLILPRDAGNMTQVTAMKQSVRTGTVDLEPDVTQVAEGTERQMMLRPTLPPLADWDFFANGPDDWKSSKKK